MTFRPMYILFALLVAGVIFGCQNLGIDIPGSPNAGESVPNPTPGTTPNPTPTKPTPTPAPTPVTPTPTPTQPTPTPAPSAPGCPTGPLTCITLNWTASTA